MRLPEAKIREAILHPEAPARQEALRYFADCFSRDADSKFREGGAHR
jgi:hypothetical protein